MSEFYLTDLSEKDKPWDFHRHLSDKVKCLYQGTELEGCAELIARCSRWLEFALSAKSEGERVFRLQSARFCRQRHCPVCQWRRSLKWKARFLKALPEITKDYPDSRWLFLTLTVKNCPITELRLTLSKMNKAWNSLVGRKAFPAIGFVRSVEVTRSTEGEAHPHFHILMMVRPSYFKGANYLSQEKWRSLWQLSLRVEYDPWVHIQVIKSAKGEGQAAEIVQALKETLKYTVKGQDLVADRDWLIELTYQLHGTRSVSLGGVLKEYLTEAENETNDDLVHVDEDAGEVKPDDPRWWFGWREMEHRYRGAPKASNRSGLIETTE